MAWSWSHTGEAYTAAQYNLVNLPREDINVIFAEWRACQMRGNRFDSNHFDMRRYDRALKWAESHPFVSVLTDFIWEKAEQAATCDNGGWNCWLCPSGCHTVPFDFPEGVTVDEAAEFLCG